MSFCALHHWITIDSRPRRRLTWKSRLLLLAAMSAAGWIFTVSVYPWLSVNQPLTDCRTVVLEGWIPDYAIRDAAERAKVEDVEMVYTTGIPIERGALLLPWGDFAHAAGATLEKCGWPREKITAVPTPGVQVDRTVASALELKAYWSQVGRSIPRRFNLVTSGSHGRRSWLAYRRIFGSEVEIGIVAVPEREFDTARWWKSSAGRKAVLGETVALLLGSFK